MSKLMDEFNKLRNDFPLIITPKTSIEINTGWVDIIRNICKESYSLPPNDIFKATQIKSKFGSLRFYIQPHNMSFYGEPGSPNSMHDIITKYEKISESTCEKCGNLGSPHGWTVMCDVCFVHSI